MKYHFRMHGGPESDRQRREDSFERYSRDDPCLGMKQLTTGFSKWSDRYLSSCFGQKNHQHQNKRMEKWFARFHEGKGRNSRHFLKLKVYFNTLEG